MKRTLPFSASCSFCAPSSHILSPSQLQRIHRPSSLFYTSALTILATMSIHSCHERAVIPTLFVSASYCSAGLTIQYPTSSVRDDPLHPRPSSPQRHSLPVSSSCSSSRSSQGTPTSPTALRGDKCASHLLTADHPNVARYLDSLARAYHAHMEKLGPSTSRFSKQSPAVCKLGKVESVNAMLGAGSDLDQQQCECILALAALKTYNNPSHPAHFALWGRSIDERTEALVTKIACKYIAYDTTQRRANSPDRPQAGSHRAPNWLVRRLGGHLASSSSPGACIPQGPDTAQRGTYQDDPASTKDCIVTVCGAHWPR